MWKKIAEFILRFRLYLIILLALITGFMGYMGTKAELAYNFVKIIPPTDEDYIFFDEFQELFGLDDNILALGFGDKNLYQIDNFKAYAKLVEEVRSIEGVKEVVSLPTLLYPEKNKAEKRFDAVKLFEQIPSSQEELDKKLAFAKSLKFYENQIINPESGATVMLVGMTSDALNSKLKQDLVWKVRDMGEAFTSGTGIKVHYSGVPYVRTFISQKVKEELNIFLALSIAITAVFLFVFFRSFSPVIYPLIVIGMVVIWTVGTLGLLGYKINILTGLLPPILVVIGIPNCIYLLNKYHQEFALHGNKKAALTSMIQKIGIVTLITNATTATGFLVLLVTDISLLEEFGVVAGINIFNTFFISIIFIPAIFSYRPISTERHAKHLNFTATNRLVAFFAYLVARQRPLVYIVTLLLTAVSLFGLWQIRAVSYMVDDLPENSTVRTDLRFFESNFNGIMPLEIVIDFGKPKALRKTSNRRLLTQLEDSLATLEYLAPPVSVARFMKAANQAFFDQSPEAYEMPAKRDLAFLRRYLKNTDDFASEKGRSSGDPSSLMNAFQDSTGQKIRISLKVADLGSVKMDSVIKADIQPMLDSAVAGREGVTAKLTGTTLIFIKGNDYLISNLKTGMLIAFVIVGLIMGFLFRNIRMILISLVSNLIPLLVTAGLMGYFNVPLKPSTVLVFSIAFGISVDDSIHFLAKYRQELKAQGMDKIKALMISLQETGTSMIYTSIILFAGFIIFAFSDFGGTVALGALTSTTLLIAMFTNLILLPVLLRTFGAGFLKEE